MDDRAMLLRKLAARSLKEIDAIKRNGSPEQEEAANKAAMDILARAVVEGFDILHMYRRR